MPQRSLGIALAALALLVCCSSVAGAALPAVPVPAENPITEPKRLLGKILFWDEQLSSDNTVACGTCHHPSAGGGDPILSLHPGADGTFATADDVHGSAGVVRRDVNGDPLDDPVFGFERQVTSRAAPNFFGGLWAPRNFWDGRAEGAFVDPLTSAPLIASGGALENQAIGPILSPVEMAKDGRTWADVTSKLASSAPLQFATNLPADVAAAIAVDPSYADLFDAAFLSPDITPARIAFAIATYERTLIADQTPWDAFTAGDSGAMTAGQQQGWMFFQTSSCAVCHPPPLFSANSFHTLGVRDPAEDTGRQVVTGLAADRGRFKTPTLRNAGLKPAFMHNGGIATLEAVIDFYQPGMQVLENLDPLMPVIVPGTVQPALEDFIANALTDPRVTNETFPFDRPTLTAAGAGGAAPVPALSGPQLGVLALLMVLSGAPVLYLRRDRL